MSYFGTRGWAEVRNYRELLVRTTDDQFQAETYPSELMIAELLDAFALSVSTGSVFPVSTESMLATAAAFEAVIGALSSPGRMVDVEQVCERAST